MLGARAPTDKKYYWYIEQIYTQLCDVKTEKSWKSARSYKRLGLYVARQRGHFVSLPLPLLAHPKMHSRQKV